MRMDVAAAGCPALLSPNSFAGRELGMRRDEPQQLAADIARGSKDGGPNHEGGPIARICIFMQVNAYSCDD